MSGKDRTQTCIWPAALFAAVILAAMVISAGCKKQNTEQTTEQNNTDPQQQKQTTGLSLNDVIRYRRGWDTTFKSWYGKMAPDFNLTDITGKQHRLSDYRGKDVMLIFWATWCGPCIMEMPSLIELRKTTDEDKLAMLAISYITTMPPNTTERVKSMVEQRKLNYTVISVDVSSVSAPYNQVNGIPCSIFIDSEGKIKLATVGVLPLDAIKAILQAK
ncbi:MAG: TlpA family protein disulfide reductase [Phycisphaerae bacterium]|nr:TlpA family protein disulfide reductase [Phycisphaerae bacterium]